MIAFARRMLAIIDDFITISLASAGVSDAFRISSSRCLRRTGSVSSSSRLLRMERPRTIHVRRSALAYIAIEHFFLTFAMPNSCKLVGQVHASAVHY